MSKFDFDVVVIGAGIIGCAVARAASQAKLRTAMVDYGAREGLGVTSRNSEVIHSGIYYPENSLKARLCVEGRKALYHYVHEKKLSHCRTGKLIVAVGESERPLLEELERRGRVNSAGPMRLLESHEIVAMEPNVSAVLGLLVQESGIVSVAELCSSLRCDVEAAGGDIAFNTAVVGLEPMSEGGWKVAMQLTSSSGKPLVGDWAPPVFVESTVQHVSARTIVNCAGLYSDWVSSLVGLKSFEHAFVKGEYFLLNKRWRGRLKRLIYPLPERNLKGLGVHATLDLGGTVRLGPNTVDIPRGEDYSVNVSNQDAFFRAARRFLPDLEIADLTPGYAGIRPKLKPLDLQQDFVINSPLEGYIQCGGIESPGVTASLAVAEYIINKFFN